MEPTNNPTPTANPVPEPVQPVQPAAPVAPVAPVPPVSPVPTVAPDAPVSAPVTALESVVPPIDGPAVTPVSDTPAAPVITPGAPNPVVSNPMFQQTDGNSPILDTSPITMPEAPKAPDPIEEELKAPLTPAAPVPGSIGSAVSMPAGASQPNTPSVAFTDPATQENPMLNTNAPAAAKPAKKPVNKTTLILLAVVAVLVVVALVVVLLTMPK